MKITQLIEKFESKEFDDVLVDLYQDPSQLETQRERYVALFKEYEEAFGDEEVSLISVPGRTEIAGNHTDHQNGKVLAGSVNLDMICVCAKAEDTRMISDGKEIEYLDSLDYVEEEKGTSTALVKGVIKGMEDKGYHVGGAHAVMRSNVLVGSGLSSSAAFEVMIGNIMNHLYNEGTVDQLEIAKISQWSENEYFGKPCGLMDQCACALGGIIYIDFYEKEDPKVEKMDLSFADYGYSLCITNTHGSHDDLTDDYAAITKEMGDIAHHFGKGVLTRVEEEDILKNMKELRETYGDRAVLRSLHMLEENKRVEAQRENVKKKDFDAFLKKIKESGDSSYKYLQNVFTTKYVNHQGVSLALCLSDLFLKENGVSRVHGGGFAGTIQAFVKNEAVKEYQEKMDEIFGEGSCMVLQINRYGAHKVA